MYDQKGNFSAVMTQSEMSKDKMDQSPLFFYNCAHGASNDPCPEHFPGQEKMPKDWLATYKPPVSPGLSDSVLVKTD